MGQDKAAVQIAGRTSLTWVRSRLANVLAEVRVVGGDSAQAIADLEPGGGPVQAIVAAGRVAPGRGLVVVACDMPWVSDRVIAELCTSLDGAQARIPRVAGRAQPLCAHYGPDAIAAFEDAWRDGTRALHRVVARLTEVAWLNLGDAAESGVVDFDTPEALAAELVRQAAIPKG